MSNLPIIQMKIIDKYGIVRNVFVNAHPDLKSLWLNDFENKVLFVFCDEKVSVSKLNIGQEYNVEAHKFQWEGDSFATVLFEQ